MATYAIGDVQGCFESLMALLETIQFNEQTDTLWFTGDLVNRGPDSLKVIRYVKSLGDRAITVLGNHDLHLLSLTQLHLRERAKHNLDVIIYAEDFMQIIDWLRTRPLIYYNIENEFCLVHAGLFPLWTLEENILRAREIEQILQSKDYSSLLNNMFGNEPEAWHENLQDMDRARFIINVFTRMRYLKEDASLDMHYKGPLDNAPNHLLPWFDFPTRKNKKTKILFGHWASLIKQWSKVSEKDNIFPLDTGCVWGEKLTALRLEDLRYFSVACQEHIICEKSSP